MQYIFDDDGKMKLLEEIQKKLNALNPNTTDEKIRELINQIPQSMLTQKEDLMMICELFAIYSRNNDYTNKRNSFKLFENIMIYIKAYLHNESSFFWSILGGLYYLKLWMYQEGLISIETIILEVKKDNYHAIGEYFFPEIIENEPEMFKKELKQKVNCEDSPECIKKFKELRQKHLKWICESGDYNDPLYSEIETDELLYTISTDNVDAFQKIIKKKSISLDSKIKGSLIQNHGLFYCEKSLLEFALIHKAFKVSKFLIMNNVEITKTIFYSVTSSRDYEMIHFVESKFPQKAPKYLLSYAIDNWDEDLTEYVFNNYNEYDFLEKVDAQFDLKEKKKVFNLLRSAFGYVNFSFIRSKIIPFFKNNPKFLKENINEIVDITFSEYAGYFSRKFVKHQDFDVNYYSEKSNHTLLGSAIKRNNSIAVGILLQNERIDVNKKCMDKFIPLMTAVGCFSDMKIVEMICKHPNLDVNLRDEKFGINSFELSVSRGNVYSLKYLIENFKNLEINCFGCLFLFTLKSHLRKTCQILLKYYLVDNNSTYDEIADMIKACSHGSNCRDEYLNDFKIIYDETVVTNND